MVKLTLSLDDHLLQRAREAALREHTSVNALVRVSLTRHVDINGWRMEAIDALKELARRNPSGSEAPWSRDELHQRQG